MLGPAVGGVGVLLDIAPAPQARKWLEALEPRQYVRMDLLPARGVDLRGDITAMPLADGCVDLLVCYHVLEHIPDDRAAMREIARVLAADGVGIVQVPWRPGTTTDEDPAAPPEERKRRFGLADHVRYYGDDFEDRLVATGLQVDRVTPEEALGAEMVAWLGLVAREAVWIVRHTSDPQKRQAPPVNALGDALDALALDLVKTRLKRDEARRKLRRARARLAEPEERRAPLQAARSLPRRAAGRLRRGVRRRLARRPGDR